MQIIKPTIANFIYAQHDHSDGINGGFLSGGAGGYVTINGIPVAGNITQWTDADTIEDSGYTTADFTPIAHISDTANPHNTTDANLSTSDITTNNATTLKHGFLPKLSGSPTQYLTGIGTYATIAGSSVPAGYSEVSFSGQTSINVLHNFGLKPIVQVLISNAVSMPYTITHNTDNDFTVTFTTSTSGIILSTIGSPQVPNVISTAISYTILTSDNIVIATASGITITVPTAVGVTGKLYTIDNDSASDITVIGTGGETIWGEVSQIIPTQSTIVLYSTGSNWRIT